MNLTINLPVEIETALRDLAILQGRSTESVAAERLIATFGAYPNNPPGNDDLKTVAEISAAFTTMDKVAAKGDFGVSVEDAFAELLRRQKSRGMGKALIVQTTV